MKYWHAYVQQSWGRGHRLYISRSDMTRRGPSGTGCVVEVVNGFTFVEPEESDCHDPCTDGIANADELLQKIMDAAWEAGFRPRGFADVKNETAALRGHLADMRAIAFHHVGTEKP